MTAVKEQLIQMVPQMPVLIPNLPEDKAQQILNMFITVNPEKLKRTDIADSGLDFGSDFTDDNHDERVNQFFALSEGIEIDEQAIKDLREASMV